MVDGIAGISSTAETQNTTALSGLAGDFDSFLNLLTVQLQNQDPTEPLDTNQLTDQIVQFTQAEQIINTNAKLDQIIALSGTSTISDAISYIDKIVEAETDAFNLRNGTSLISYQLPSSAKEVSVSITAPDGTVIKTFVGDTAGGLKHKVAWDGTDFDGNQMPDGEYKIVVNAKDHAGNDMDASTFATDLVTEVDLNGTDTTLFFGDIIVSLDSIRAIKSLNADF